MSTNLELTNLLDALKAVQPKSRVVVVVEGINKGIAFYIEGKRYFLTVESANIRNSIKYRYTYDRAERMLGSYLELKSEGSFNVDKDFKGIFTIVNFHH